VSKKVFRVRLKEPLAESNGDEAPRDVTFIAYRVKTPAGVYFIVPFIDGQLAAKLGQVVVERS